MMTLYRNSSWMCGTGHIVTPSTSQNIAQYNNIHDLFNTKWVLKKLNLLSYLILNHYNGYC